VDITPWPVACALARRASDNRTLVFISRARDWIVKKFSSHTFLKMASAPAVLGMALLSTSAFAQAPQAAEEAGEGESVIVTGSLISGINVAVPSPVSTLSTVELEARGISTVQEGIQRIAANNGPALTNSFTANGAFAGGASAVSLRGLTTNSTLVLFDGMRAAYYPLADDGTRNFVDLNTIPDDAVDRIETLRDGASSTYGADAIAGVVNIITKKNVQGFSGRAEAGISSRGDAGQQRLSLTAGIGDLNSDGYNAYVTGFYYHQAMLKNNQRPYPFNTDDFSGIYNSETDTYGFNGIVNGLQHDGFTGGYGGSTPFAVRPRVAATGGAVSGRTRYAYLNGCGSFSSYTPSAAELALPQNAVSPSVVCQEDITERYGVINPDVERFGFTARVTAKYGDTGEAFASFNFIQSASHDTYIPSVIRANSPAPFYFPRYSTSTNVLYYGNNTVLQLPVYVCPRQTIGACDAVNGTLNPNNPYAAEGYTAAITGRIPNMFEDNYSRTRAYRAAIGFRGDITDNWSYSVNGTGMHMDLLRRYNGYVYIQHLLDVIKDGSYNFRDPSANSQAVLDYIAPELRGTSTSDLFQADANVTGALAALPGGDLSVAFGASIRYEAVDSPSINSDFNGGTERYFRLNGFGTKGDRTVWSLYGELNAPVIEEVTVNLAGRYDRYPNGIDNFSPKAGIVIKPIGDILTLRGTYSRGFRIPSFGEANATYPTTGYVTANAAIFPDSYLALYGCSKATYSSCPSYLQTSGYSYGATSLANPNLKPEKSRSFTLGIGVEPMNGITFTAEYYNIEKTDVITTASNTPALLAYYSGQAIPAGYSVVADAPDPNNPNLLPRVAFVQAQFINANKLRTEGLDLALDVRIPVSGNVTFTTNAEASYIIRLETEFPDGTVERYDGTLGNFNLTAGSGTPKWKGTWTSAVEVGDALTISATANYFDGYDLSAMDQGTGFKDCGLNDGSLPCRVKEYVTFDLNGQVKVNDNFTLYATMQNVFDRMPSIDTVTYGAHGYNPVQGGEGILGRYFKVGVKANF
jgi:iron complex outermembrane receptor protein